MAHNEHHRLIQTFVNNIKRAIRRKRYGEADTILERLKAQAPVACETRGLELELLIAKKRTDEAGRLARQLVEQFSGSGRILYLAGQAAYYQKDFKRAAKLFEESVRVFPHPGSRRWLAKAWTALQRFDDGEALLLDIVDVEPFARTDLAWLYECQGDWDRALSEVEKILDDFPDYQAGKEQKLRLEAKSAGRGEVIEEVETLEDLGEEVPEPLFSEYVKSLFTSGQAKQAREAVAERKDSLTKGTLKDLAWACYHLQIHDVACDLFLLVFEDQVANYKFLNSLENAAGSAGKLEELAAFYEERAEQHPNLFGRLNTLKARISGGNK